MLSDLDQPGPAPPNGEAPIRPRPCNLPRPPDAVARAAVAPAALHLLEAVDAAFLPAEAAARPINEVHTRLGVDGEVQEEADHLTVHQDPRLRGPCGHRSELERMGQTVSAQRHQKARHKIQPLFSANCHGSKQPPGGGVGGWVLVRGKWPFQERLGSGPRLTWGQCSNLLANGAKSLSATRVS